jgi:organic hydroperoxide reductase OsmC/OhrA
LKKEHHYSLSIEWTGNLGTGTTDYRSYGRSHIIQSKDKPAINASSDPAFLGDHSKYNPEELLVASLSSCHMLWFLHLCTENGIVVLEYSDNPLGTMIEDEDGSGKFSEVLLRPLVKVAHAEMITKVEEIHAQAHHYCFIANSVNFTVKHKPTTIA